MKLFYTPVERLLLTIHDPATVALNKFLWNKAWDIWTQLDDKRGPWGETTQLTNKEARLAAHVAGLLQI
jgi:hypothetical protein